MRRFPCLLLLISSLLLAISAINVDEVLSKMSLKQKIGQMMQLTTEAIMAGPQSQNYDLNKLAGFFAEYGIGSLYNTPFMGSRSGKLGWTCQEWIQAVADIQKKVTDLGYPPLLIGLDSLHGTNYIVGSTIFPHNIGLAATFDPFLVELAGMITGKDSRTCGVAWNFGPSADIALQPLWARHYETFGSDPYLNAVMVRASVRGYQRSDTATPNFDFGGKNTSSFGSGGIPQMLTTTKHWVGYSNPDSGADRTDATISDWMLQRYYLPSFSSCIAEDTASVMLNSGTMNHIPGHADTVHIQTLLRQQLEFQGFCLSDYEDVQNLQTKHKVAATLADAVQMAFNAGLDMAMAPWDLQLATQLYQLVQSGKVPQSIVDTSARRILEAKNKAGLFDKPFGYPNNANTVGSIADRAVAQRTIEEGVTLLKNANNALPLRNGASDMAKKTVLVTGAWGNSLTLESGGWTWQWQGALSEATFQGRGTTIFSGLDSATKSLGWNIQYIQGFGISTQAGDYGAAIAAAASADAVIVCLGEKPYAEMLNNINDLAHPGTMSDFVAALKNSAGAKPVILLMMQGRPRIAARAFQAADAILYGYLPGPEAGSAIARILLGEVNPSGRLPFDYPSQTGQRHLNYGSFKHNSLWDFGFGLSYTTFSVADLELSTDNYVLSNGGAPLSVSATVSNTGSRDGKEVVFVYITEIFPQNEQVQMLKRFHKVSLRAGQKHRLTFQLRAQDFRYSIPQTPGSPTSLVIQVKIGSSSDVLTANVAFSSMISADFFLPSMPDLLPDNLTRPSSFVPPGEAPPVSDTPFVPVDPPIAPSPDPVAVPVATFPIDPPQAWWESPVFQNSPSTSPGSTSPVAAAPEVDLHIWRFLFSLICVILAMLYMCL